MNLSSSCSHAGGCAPDKCAAGCPQNQSHCGKCCGGSCSRPAEVTLTAEMLALLRDFARFAFLPVACRTEEMPVYLGAEADEGTGCMNISNEKIATTSRCLLALKAQGVITIDYNLPLSGFDYRQYNQWPVHGSMALTELGQTVLDSL